MSLFKNMFGTSGEEQQPSRIEWRQLTDLGQLNEIAALSNEKPVLIFKHSTRCSISRFALKQFENEFDLAEVRAMLEAEEGVIVQDDPKNFVYPMPINAHGKDEVFVGRIRRDETQPKTLNLWIVADNLRKGAATNAVQIAEYLAKHDLI